MESTGDCMSDLIVSEIFGPTFQGEGPSLGTPCVFLRLGTCNLKCVWCDTKYTWDFASGNYDPKVELHRMSEEEILTRIKKLAGDHVKLLVISGGEPLIQQEKLKSLVESVRLIGGWRVEVETAGTIAPDRELGVTTFNVSPKLLHSGNDWNASYKPYALRKFVGLPDWGSTRVNFKFVVQCVADLEEVWLSFVEPFHIPAESVYIMPEGISPEQLKKTSQELAPEVVARGWNFTTRLHILVWDNARGY